MDSKKMLKEGENMKKIVLETNGVGIIFNEDNVEIYLLQNETLSTAITSITKVPKNLEYEFEHEYDDEYDDEYERVK